MKSVFLFLLVTCNFVSIACGGKRIRLQPQVHENIVKYETHQVDFYFDAALVKDWVNKAIATNDVLYFANGGRNDSALVVQLNNARVGDTIVLRDRIYSGVRYLLDEKIFELCKAGDVPDLNIYDKERKEFISKIHARQYKARTSHSYCTMYTLVNADHFHARKEYFYFYSFDHHGWF